MGQQPIVLSDCRIKLTKDDSFANYPDEMRMIEACVLQDGNPCLMKFITNQFEWSPYSICDLYLARWGIEVFFKEIKQTLQLADFLGTSENAIKWQIWTALLTYLLLRLVAWRSKILHKKSPKRFALGLEKYEINLTSRGMNVILSMVQWNERRFLTI